MPAELSALASPHSSELRELVERFTADRDELLRFYDFEGSELRRRRLREFETAWKARLAALPGSGLGVEGRIDRVLLAGEVAHELRLLDREEARAKEMAPVIPFAPGLMRLIEARRLMEPVNPQAAAEELETALKQVKEVRAALEAGVAASASITAKAVAAPAGGTQASAADGAAVSPANATTGDQAPSTTAVVPLRPTRVVAARALVALAPLRTSLDEWFKFYDSYHPEFGWWTRTSYKALSDELDGYAKFVREKVVGAEPGKDEPIVGDPIGREGLQEELSHEMIAYSPEQLIAIANREFAWCDAELRKASREMGFGDDWKAAMAKVKEEHVAPGDQPQLVRDLALEAIRYVQEKDLVTVPPLAADFWRIQMMSPARQKVAPFFLGGPDILVAYPTDTMDYEDKIQSLRANNVHFARATVFHELIPGHHLQYYYGDRYNPHRELFTTPFWVEGWAVWWELQFWDLGFPRSPEDRMGMLFWRTHRCARILFSLNFHLGNWTPEQCVDFLVDRVGHERASATGEVRRSFNGSYPPLYQAGYMLGALQLRALHAELVGGHVMTDRQFHDRIMEGGPMPIEMVRARLRGEKVPDGFVPAWKFAG